jgi:hypothetical protein
MSGVLLGWLYVFDNLHYFSIEGHILFKFVSNFFFFFKYLEENILKYQPKEN